MHPDPRPQADGGASAPLEGTADAWVEAHADALYRYALGRVGSPEVAEDLVQETFLGALGALGRFERRSTARTWLVAILRRKIVDHFRRAGGGVTMSSEGTEATPVAFFDEEGVWLRPPGRWPSPDRAVEDAEFREVLAGCVGRLPPHLAEPFLLREAEEKGADEVCRILNLSAANLRVRLHRARLLLRDCLQRNWFDDPGDSPGRSRET